MRLTIGLDADGVLWDMMTPLLMRYRRVSRHPLRLHEVTEWDVTKFLTPDFGSSRFWRLRTPDLYDNIQPLAGMPDEVKKLSRMGHYLVVVTADRGDEIIAAKARAVRRLYPELRDIVVAFDKRAAVPGLDILVDDGPHNDPDILVTWPWNKDVPLREKGQVRLDWVMELANTVAQYGRCW